MAGTLTGITEQRALRSRAGRPARPGPASASARPGGQHRPRPPPSRGGGGGGGGGRGGGGGGGGGGRRCGPARPGPVLPRPGPAARPRRSRAQPPGRQRRAPPGPPCGERKFRPLPRHRGAAAGVGGVGGVGTMGPGGWECASGGSGLGRGAGGAGGAGIPPPPLIAVVESERGVGLGTAPGRVCCFGHGWERERRADPGTLSGSRRSDTRGDSTGEPTWGRAVSSPHLRTDVATALETRRGVGGSPVLGAMGRKFLPGEQPVPLSFQRVGLAGISCKAERSHYCVTLE